MTATAGPVYVCVLAPLLPFLSIVRAVFVIFLEKTVEVIILISMFINMDFKMKVFTKKYLEQMYRRFSSNTSYIIKLCNCLFYTLK